MSGLTGMWLSGAWRFPGHIPTRAWQETKKARIKRFVEGLSLVHRPTPQRGSGSESWPGASPRCWPCPALEEARFGELCGNFRELKDDLRRYLPHAVQNRLLDSHAWTSRRPAACLRRLRRFRGRQRTVPGFCPRTRQNAPDRPEKAAGYAGPPPGQRAYRAPLLPADGSRPLLMCERIQPRQIESGTLLSCVYA